MKRSVQQKISLIVALVFISGGIFYLIKGLERQKELSFDYITKGCEIEGAINQTLEKCGVHPGDILKQYSEEKRKGNIIWVERTKLIKITEEWKLNRYQREIQNTVEKIGAELLDTRLGENKKQLRLTIGVNNIPLEILTFRREARIAIVIDDFGYQMDLALKFFEIPLGLTCSILPRLKYSKQLAELASTYDKEVWLHLPLQPYGYPEINPGPGALFVDMSAEQLQKVFKRDLKTVPGAKCVDNHMGSKFTEDRGKMTELGEFIKAENLCFLDNQTSPKSVAYEIAQELGIKSARRGLVLDIEEGETKDVYSIEEKLQELVQTSIEAGEVIAVGHIRESTYQALATFYPEFARQGIKVVPASELMR